MAFTSHSLQLEKVWRGIEVRQLEVGDLVELPNYVRAVDSQGVLVGSPQLVTITVESVTYLLVEFTTRATYRRGVTAQRAKVRQFISEADLKRKTMHSCPMCECKPEPEPEEDEELEEIEDEEDED